MEGSGIRYNVRRLLLDAAAEVSVPPASEHIDVNRKIEIVLLVVVVIMWVMWWVMCLHSSAPVAATSAVEERDLWRIPVAAVSGMKERDLGRIPVAEYGEGAGIGTICLADFAEGERVRVLPGCMHRFHVACIGRWLMSNASCPNCRKSVLGNKAAAGCGRRRPDVESGGGGS